MLPGSLVMKPFPVNSALQLEDHLRSGLRGACRLGASTGRRTIGAVLRRGEVGTERGRIPMLAEGEGSVSRGIGDLKGDQAAAQPLWERDFDRLVRLADARLRAAQLFRERLDPEGKSACPAI